MHKVIYSFLFLIFALSSSLYSQISEGGTPRTWNLEKLPSLNSKEIMPLINIESLKTEDEAENQFKDQPYRFAYGHEVNFTSQNSGSWFYFPNGDRLWRLKIQSKEALSMNVTFSNYHIPDGADLFIYSSDESYKIGAFTSANNKENGSLGTTPIPGDEIVIEYFEPSYAAFEGELEIETVAHAYQDIFKIAKNVSQNKDFGDSGNCNNNVICPEAEDWADQVRSVAMITLANGTRLCTGSLLNNTNDDGTPYFLTANHCLGSGTSNWVFIFNYFSDICDEGGDGNDGSLLESVAGCSILANTQSGGGTGSTDPNQTDMALLLLDETPPDDYTIFYSGWDWSGIAPATAVGIHHPSGDVKKISWDTDETGISGYLDYSGTAGGTTHWHINDWEDGTTEGGSSGSPLFNDSYQVIGQLHGGLANCSNNVDDYYGRLALSFPYIQEWLDPDSSGVTSINGWPSAIILGTDPGIQPIQGLQSSYCNENTISPILNLKNYGISEITAVDIEYFIDGNIEGTYNWTGTLQNGESESIILDPITINETGAHVFSASFSYSGDENENNNEREYAFYSIIGGTTLTINILTDEYASETSWGVYTMDGLELASNPDYDNSTLYEEEVCIPDTCVEFIIYDSYGDGICCQYGEGYYTLIYNDIELGGGAEFTDEESTVICPNIINGIEDEDPLQGFSVYPNPAKDLLFLSLSKVTFTEFDLHLQNALGQDLISRSYSSFNALESLDVGELPRGLYILELSGNDTKRSYKIILE